MGASRKLRLQLPLRSWVFALDASAPPTESNGRAKVPQICYNFVAKNAEVNLAFATIKSRSCKFKCKYLMQNACCSRFFRYFALELKID